MDEDADLDPGEAFDKAQVARIMATDPESGAFFAAKKRTALAVTSGRGATGKQQPGALKPGR